MTAKHKVVKVIAAVIMAGTCHSRHGRDNGFHAHDQYTETKTIWIDLNDPSEGDNIG